MTAPVGKPEDLCVVSAGARTPVGLDMPSTAAAVAAGIAPFAEHPFMIDRYGEPMIVARDSELPEDLMGPQRLVELLLPALKEALDGLERSLRPEDRIPLLLALPPVRPGQAPDLSKKVIDGLTREFKSPRPFPSSAVFSTGHAGGLQAVEEACRRMSRGEADLCIVAGVDSYHDPETLEWLDEQEQLKSEQHTWGFTPGEAAGAFVLATRKWAGKAGCPILGSVVGVGCTRETNLIHSDAVCLGRGLSEAILKGVGPILASGEKVDQTWCDLNGQPYRSEEFGYAATRVSGRFADASEFTAPADCWGDVGAATAPLLILQALLSGRKAAKGPRQLIWGSSDGGERGSVLLRLEPGTEGN